MAQALQALVRPYLVPVVSLFKLGNSSWQLKPGVLVHGPDVCTNSKDPEVIQRSRVQERGCRMIGRSPVNDIFARLADELRSMRRNPSGGNITLNEDDIAFQDDSGNPESGTGSLLTLKAVTCMNKKRRVPKSVSDLSTTTSTSEPAVPIHLFSKLGRTI